MNQAVNHDYRYMTVLAASNTNAKVGTLTHSYYRYPARFGEMFVREAIGSFSKEGETVLDPFCGGGTTLVEALSSGRGAIGSDLSELAIFVARAKTTPLNAKQLTVIERWLEKTTRRVANLLRVNCASSDTRLTGVPGPHRNLISNIRASLLQLPQGECQLFARCLLLKTSQWAFDGKEVLPTPSQFVARLSGSFIEMKFGMAAYTERLSQLGLTKSDLLRRRRLFAVSAERLPFRLDYLDKPNISLVVTSPPYFGVHVLYNRWQLQGRRELQAPFFITERADHGAPSSYTIVARRVRSPNKYFKAIASSFRSIVTLLNDRAYVIQLVSFNDSESSLPLYLSALRSAGLELCDTYLRLAGELTWRSVPGRRWYARVGAIADSSAAREVLLIHRKER